MYSKLGFVDSNVSPYYYSVENETWKHKVQHVQHFIAALSLEGCHTIRVSGKDTFYYGFKLPYYFSPYKKQFDPKYQNDLFYGLEPEISIGITHVIGSCD